MTVIRGSGGTGAEIDKVMAALRVSPVPQDGEGVCHYRYGFVTSLQTASVSVQAACLALVLQNPSVVTVITAIRFRSVWSLLATSGGTRLQHTVTRYNLRYTDPSDITGLMSIRTPTKKRRSYPEAKTGVHTIYGTNGGGNPGAGYSSGVTTYVHSQLSCFRPVVTAGVDIPAHVIDYPNTMINNPRERHIVLRCGEALTLHAGASGSGTTNSWRISGDIAWTEYPSDLYNAVR